MCDFFLDFSFPLNGNLYNHDNYKHTEKMSIIGNSVNSVYHTVYAQLKCMPSEHVVGFSKPGFALRMLICIANLAIIT